MRRALIPLAFACSSETRSVYPVHRMMGISLRTLSNNIASLVPVRWGNGHIGDDGVKAFRLQAKDIHGVQAVPGCDDGVSQPFQGKLATRTAPGSSST